MSILSNNIEQQVKPTFESILEAAGFERIEESRILLSSNCPKNLMASRNSPIWWAHGAELAGFGVRAFQSKYPEIWVIVSWTRTFIPSQYHLEPANNAWLRPADFSSSLSYITAQLLNYDRIKTLNRLWKYEKESNTNSSAGDTCVR